MYIYIKTMIISPSLIAHCINGLLLVGSLLLVYNNFNKIEQMHPYYIIILILLLAITIGIHGLSHLGMEYIYKYNPLKLDNKI